MSPKSLSLFIAICSIFLLSSTPIEASAALGGRKVSPLGDWHTISNLTAPEVLEIGDFAVKEHNQLTNSRLSFMSVVRGETQVVSGVNYRLVLSAKYDAETPACQYRVVVWDKPWMKQRQLTSFEKID